MSEVPASTEATGEKLLPVQAAQEMLQAASQDFKNKMMKLIEGTPETIHNALQTLIDFSDSDKAFWVGFSIPVVTSLTLGRAILTHWDKVMELMTK